MEVVIGVLGVAATVIGSWIAFSQGRAAERRGIFDRRLPTIREIERTLRVAAGSTDRDDLYRAFFDFVRAQADAKYLFGADVAGRLEDIRRDFAAINAFSALRGENPDQQEMIDLKCAAIQRIAAFLDRSSELFPPYVRAEQPTETPAWVQRARGNNQLSPKRTSSHADGNLSARRPAGHRALPVR